MYLHVGNNKNIKLSDIVGIFDTDTATISKNTKNYLSGSEKRGETVNVTYTVYFSQLSVKTLCQRAEDIL